MEYETMFDWEAPDPIQEAKKRKDPPFDKEISYRPLDSLIAGKYAGYCQLLEDIRMMVKLLQRLVKDYDLLQKNYEIGFAFWTSFIVTYGKCFVSAEGRSGVKVDFNAVTKDQNLIEKHKEIMKIRNKFVAHGGDSLLVKVTPILVDRDQENIQRVIGVTSMATLPPKKHLSDYVSVVSELFKFTDDKCKLLAKKIGDEIHGE